MQGFLLNHFSLVGYWGNFQFGNVINNVVMNIFLYTILSLLLNCKCSSPLYKIIWNNHIFGPPHPWIPKNEWKTPFLICGWMNSWIWNSGIWKAGCTFIEKNMHTGGSTQFKLMLLKGQLYIQVNKMFVMFFFTLKSKLFRSRKCNNFLIPKETSSVLNRV